MGCHGGFSLDDATRRSWYSPEAVLQNLRPGMIFIDIGCGDGFFSVLAAKKVGSTGKVFAVDIDASAIKKLEQKTEAEGLKNVFAKVGKAEDTVFCTGCADFIFYSMDLHDFSEPTKALKNARQMMKANGQLIDLDWKKMNMSFGPPMAIRFNEEKASSLLRSAGFTIADIRDVGPYHYLIVAKS